MIFFFYLNKFILNYHKCNHENIFKNITTIITPRKNQKIVLETKQPFKITFDYTYLNSPDSKTCQAISDQITWGFQTYTCLEADLLNSSKIQIITETLNNLNIYLNKLLKVNSFNENITIVNWNNYAGITQKTVSNTDLHITVLARPYGNSNTLASAAAYQFENGQNRPIQGFIFINVAQLPFNSEDINSNETNFFHTCFHETLHVLGISSNLFSKWIDIKTNLPYNPFLSTTLTKGTKSFKIIHTPEAHKYAKNRFGLETFTNGTHSCDSGIEFEDGGGQGTAGSHPEARVYFNEVMVGLTVQDTIISDLSLALLVDTGWYEVNYSLSRGLPWGNGNLIYNSPLTEFPLGSPQNVFPSHYLCNSSNYNNDSCTYDFKAHGICQTTSHNCANDFQLYCENQIFFNPKNFSIVGISSIHDYILYKAPYSNRVCTNIKSDIFYSNYEYLGKDSRCHYNNNNYPVCLKTRCDDLKLFLIINNIEKECEFENQILNFNLIQIKCHDPLLFCKTELASNYLSENPFNFTPFPTPIILPNQTPNLTISYTLFPSNSKFILPTESQILGINFFDFSKYLFIFINLLIILFWLLFLFCCKKNNEIDSTSSSV